MSDIGEQLSYSASEIDKLLRLIDEITNSLKNNNTIGQWENEKINSDNTVTANYYVRTSKLLDLVYPVGSIYLSVNDTPPKDLFKKMAETEWEQIKDTFLLAAGGTYKANVTGGESSHILSTNEMPAHKHTNDVTYLKGESISNTITNNKVWVASQNPHPTNSKKITSDSAGGGEAHNNMPPYLTVYMWKRVK